MFFGRLGSSQVFNFNTLVPLLALVLFLSSSSKCAFTSWQHGQTMSTIERIKVAHFSSESTREKNPVTMSTSATRYNDMARALLGPGNNDPDFVQQLLRPRDMAGKSVPGVDRNTYETAQGPFKLIKLLTGGTPGLINKEAFEALVENEIKEEANHAAYWNLPNRDGLKAIYQHLVVKEVPEQRLMHLFDALTPDGRIAKMFVNKEPVYKLATDALNEGWERMKTYLVEVKAFDEYANGDRGPLRETDKFLRYYHLYYEPYSRFLLNVLIQASKEFRLNLKGLTVPNIWFACLEADELSAIEHALVALKALVRFDLDEVETHHEEVRKSLAKRNALLDGLSILGLTPPESKISQRYPKLLSSWNAAAEQYRPLPSFEELKGDVNIQQSERIKLEQKWGVLAAKDHRQGSKREIPEESRRDSLQSLAEAIVFEWEAEIGIKIQDSVMVLKNLLLARESLTSCEDDVTRWGKTLKHFDPFSPQYELLEFIGSLSKRVKGEREHKGS